MPTEIKLPRLGQGMDEGRIIKWLKSEGDQVAKGDEIYEVETEKVNVEVEAPADGTLLKIAVPEGETVPIGTVIGYIGDKGEAVPEAPAGGAGASGNGKAPKAAAAAQDSASSGGTTTERAAEKKPAQLPEREQEAQPERDKQTPRAAEPAVGTPGHAPGGGGGDARTKASPLARRMAGERGIDLAQVRGTGPDGRIVARDLEGAAAGATGASARGAGGAAAAQAPPAPGGERVELTSMRRTIARRLTEAWQAPAFYLTVDIDMEQANALRKKLVASMREGDVKPTVGDIVTKACAASLRRHPDVNSHFVGDAIVRFAETHIGIAVATEAGLVVPVIRDAHAKSIREIAAERSDLARRAHSGKLQPQEFEGGTFTISNLGMMGIDEFSAVLNPPQSCILAVGATSDRAVVRDRKIVARPVMTITLTCDHRSVDGAVGARFLQTLKSSLEDPLTML